MQIKILTIEFSKSTKIQNIMKIHPVEAQLFHREGRTDGRTNAKLIGVFRNFANSPKIQSIPRSKHTPSGLQKPVS